jgi:hypothetical protein
MQTGRSSLFLLAEIIGDASARVRQNIKLRFFLPYSIALLLLYPRVTTVVPVHKGNACMPLYFINFCTKSKRARHLCVFVWLIRAVTDIQRFRQNQKEPLG